MNSNRDLIIAAYKAFNAREIDTILAMLRPDVDWPNGMEGGRVNGRHNVRQYWTRYSLARRGDPECSIGEEDEAGRSVVRVHQVVHDLAGNLVVDQFVEHVYTIRDGLIERMDIREADQNRAATGSA